MPRIHSHSTLLVSFLFALTTLAPTLEGTGISEAALTPPMLLPLGGATPDQPCGNVTTRVYDVVALRLPVSYNHWGDFDPDGRLFVLRENVGDLLRQLEARLLAAGLDPALWSLEDVRRALGLPPGTAPDAARLATNAADALAPFDTVDLEAPLVVRAHRGDCVVFRLTNLLPEPASLHVHAVVSGPGQGLALGANADDLTLPGLTRTYVVYVPVLPGMEGAHLLHSHADTRHQTKHGLFGALVVEPDGAAWRSMADRNQALASGVEAIITFPDRGPDDIDFREYVLLYHDEIQLVDRAGLSLPIVSPYGEYGPGSKGINLRSEPFMNRFQLHDALQDAGVLPRGFDKSQGYGSYTYGDPGVYIPRAYVGDPTKFRLLNAGSQHHVHHLHGGGDRWRTSPVADDTQFAIGLTKEDNAYTLSASDRVDVQNIGPGESFNAEIEGGAGGVQQGVGDFLFHCHIAEHYVGGMWSFWRVYDTHQDALDELPQRAGNVSEAVDSGELFTQYQTSGELPNGQPATESNFRAWVEGQLPPQGRPRDDDASVWDWAVNPSGSPLYQGEPETLFNWPNYHSAAPGERPTLAFNPGNGRLAYPLLAPHLGQRPPFAPHHGPAPYLGPDEEPGRPDGLCPGTSGQDGDPRNRDYRVTALSVPVHYNDHDVDLSGSVFVQSQFVDDVLENEDLAKNLVLRANVGDCVDITLTSDLEDNEESHDHSKVNMHIHLVQFDTQASDGVITGLQYEQSVRPADAGAEGTTVTSQSGPDGAGRWTIGVADVAPFLDAAGNDKVGSLVGLGLTRDTFEEGRLVGVDEANGTILLDPNDPGGFQYSHMGGLIGYEFVHYRWYADVELGIVYWHDHVDGLNSWRHGLFGSLIVEPAGSRWLRPDRSDPFPAQDEPNGTLLDIVGPNGSYRELVLAIQDRSGCIDGGAGGCSSGTTLESPNRERELASFNLRSEPLHRRDPTFPLSNAANGNEDPDTDVLRAYAGDRVLMRVLYTGQSSSTGVGTFALAGHRFQAERNLTGSRLASAISLGISSHLNLEVDCGAGSCAQLHGDYLYQMSQPGLLDRGAWGVFRVFPSGNVSEGLQPLRVVAQNGSTSVYTPPAPAVSAAALSGPPDRYYNVSARRADVVFGQAPLGTHLKSLPVSVVPPDPVAVCSIQALAPGVPGTVPTVATDWKRCVKTFADERDAAEVAAGRATPLVLRARPHELVQINLTNDLVGDRLSLHAGLLQAADADSLGLPVGRNNATAATVAPGGVRAYRYYADEELGAAYLTSYGRFLTADGRPANPALEGLYGALVVEPANSTFQPDRGASSNLTVPGRGAVREHVLLYTSNDPEFHASVMPYTADVRRIVGVNYRNERLHERVGGQVPVDAFESEALTADVANVGGMSLGTCQLDAFDCGTPGLKQESETPGATLEVRNPLNPFAFSSTRHGDPDTPLLDATRGGALVVRALGGAGDQLLTHSVYGHWWRIDPALDGSNLVDTVTLGPGEVSNAWIDAVGCGGAGDYFWGSHRAAFLEAGAWGLLRVADGPAPAGCLGAPAANDVVASVAGTAGAAAAALADVTCGAPSLLACVPQPDRL